jgi:hypothetical protein
MRAAIVFARVNGFASLRETIPNILTFDRDAGGWRPFVPNGDGFGGLRSLGSTLNACAAEGQPCRVLAATRGRAPVPDPTGQRAARIGALLEFPLAPARPDLGRGIPVAQAGGALAPLLAALARRAGVPLAEGADAAA